MKISALGYNSYFESRWNEIGQVLCTPARVICQFKEAYKVKDATGEYFAKVTGKQMFRARTREDFPAVGDWVAITKSDPERAVIHVILPRLTVIRRRVGDRNGRGGESQIIASNIDYAFVVESTRRDFNLNRFERYFSLVRAGRSVPVIILNKIDLISGDELKDMAEQIRTRFPGVDLIATSTFSSAGLSELRNYIERGKTYCFLGSSGVGKSSIVNKLLGKEIIRTETISSYSGRGKHITTGRQMYFLPDGGIVIDNPGMREVGITGGEGVDIVFDDIAVLAESCKYLDCTHVHEPGCGVLEALNSGNLDAEKYANYIRLKKEAEYNEMTDIEKREKDRQFGKFIKKVKKDLTKFKE